MSVNDYLARRDAEWMRPVYDLLGVTAGWIGQASTPEQRRQAYAADICYASANEIGFDVLRDRLATAAGDLVTVTPDVVLIDEADSVLVDEALIPLVLAGSVGDADPVQDMAADRQPAAAPAALRGGRRAAQRLPDRRGRPDRRAGAGRHRPVRGSQPGRADPAQRRAARPGAAAAGRGLHRPGRPDPAGQRVPRPGRPAAALAGRPAGGGGGQRGPAAPPRAARSWTASPSSPWSGGTRWCAG